MASGTILCSSAQPWALIRLGIKERQRGKMHGRVPHPLERGIKLYTKGKVSSQKVKQEYLRTMQKILKQGGEYPVPA
jgi:hypothetical protein